MTKIGKMFGISRERVRQILEKKVKSMIKQPTDKEKLILLFQEYIALDNAITTFMDQRKKKLKMELMSRLECIKYQINALMQSEYPNLPNDFDVPTLQKYLQDI